MARPRADRISISGLKLMPRIGVSPGERRLPQGITADVSVWGDLEEAGMTDSLARTFNYSEILKLAVEVSQSKEFNLLESLGYEIGRAILRTFPVTRANVRLKKRPASTSELIDFVEVEVELP